MKNVVTPHLVAFLSCIFFSVIVSGAPQPEALITEPVSIAQYDDAVIIYLNGFDVARLRYPSLELKYRLILPSGIAGSEKTLDLTKPWEKPAIILRKDSTEYAGIVISASSGANIFFRRFYSLSGTINAPTIIPTLAQNSAIELGQFVSQAPSIPLPDRTQFADLVVGAAGRTYDLDAGTLQVKSEINYPQVSSGQLSALSRQTDFPNDDTKRSIYIPLKSQLYNQTTGIPSGVAHYLCEIPLDANWLNGTEDLTVNLTSSQIKVHRSDLTDGGTNILGGGGGGLGQGTGTMDVDSDGNIYFSNSVPTDVVRFNVSTATFQVPPTDLLPLSNLYLPTEDDILENGDTVKKIGRWQTYRMVASMNHSTPKRMLYARTISKVVPWNNNAGKLYEWSALFTLPKDHWDDPVAFANEFRLLVGSWPSTQHSYFDTLPVIDGPNRRQQFFTSYGNTTYAKNYPGSEGGPWRVDVASDNTVEDFGTALTWSGDDGYSDGTSKTRDVKPYNAGNKINWFDYGVMEIERSNLSYCLTGTTDNSLTGLIEVNYDAIAYMLEHSAEFTTLLDNIGGPSLAPSYLATPIPGQQGKLLGVGEYGYYFAEFDVNQVTPGEVDKDYLLLDSGDPTVELPLAVGLGPYGNQWANIDGDDWLYIGGYTGLTRMKYSDNGVPLERHTMHEFQNQLTTVNLDAAGGGAIKRSRYIQHGLDDRMFLTGTHTAARGGTAYSGGLMSFHQTDLDTLWKLSYMSRCCWGTKLRNRVLRDLDGIPVQEFCLTSFFYEQYANTIAPELVPVNQDTKVFMWDYKSGGQMRDLMGFSMAPLDGITHLESIAYSQDRRYMIIRQGDQLVTFDPQANRFVDGKTLSYGSELQFGYFARPSYNFTRAPDDRLFLYLRTSDTSTNGMFIEIRVSPEGVLSIDPYLEVQASTEAVMDDSFGLQHTYLPDYANDDGSFDLFLGQQLATSGGGTVCRVIEDFVPPRRHVLDRTLNLLSSGIGGASITGSKPGTTPYSSVCSNGENVNLTAAPSVNGHLFREWHDEAGNVLGTQSSLQLAMSADRIITAVYDDTPSNSTTVNPLSKLLDHQSQTYAITVTSNTSWTATSPPAWASVNPASGTGNGQITVTVQANGNGSSRNGTITIGGNSHSIDQQAIPPLGGVPGVAASNNSYSEKIRISWASLVNAESYHVFRSSINDFSQATEIAQVSTAASGYDDAVVTAGTTYYYWVLGWRASSGVGPEGSGDSGERATDTGGNSAVEATSLSFVVGTATQNGTLEAGDSDWYTFTVSPSRYVEIYTIGSVDTIGAIYSVDDLSSPINSISEDDDEGDGENFRSREALDMGTYYVRVFGSGDNQSGAYQLHVEMDTIANFFPDLWAGPSRGRMNGNDRYSLSGAGQTFAIKKRRYAIYYMRAQNDGNVPEELRIKGQRNNRKFKFNYYRLTGGISNVSGHVGNGTFATRSLDPGESTDFKIKVTPRYRRGLTRRQTMKVRVYSVAQPFRQDVGKPIITITR